MLTVYIEENANSQPSPLEVAENAPVAQLVPALVQELGLPQTDLFGNPLMYVLRDVDTGYVVPDSASLQQAGVLDGALLRLDSVLPEDVPTMQPMNSSAWGVTQQPGKQPSSGKSQGISRKTGFYQDMTIADDNSFVLPEPITPPSMGNIGSMGSTGTYGTQQLDFRQPSTGQLGRTYPRKSSWSRRALLMTGGAIVGLAGVGIGYAALRGGGANPNSMMANQNKTGTTAITTTNKKGTTPTAAATTKPTTTTNPSPTATKTQNMMTTVPTKLTQQFVFQQHQQAVQSVVFAPDGTMLASGANDKMFLTWSLAGKVNIQKTLGNAVKAVAWSPSSGQIAVAQGTAVNFYNAQNGTLLSSQANTHTLTVDALAWSQQNTLVSAGIDKLAVVWNPQNFKPAVLFKLHNAAILSTGWATGTQSIATGSQGGFIRVWNGTNGQNMHDYFFDGAIAQNTLAWEPVANGTRLAIGGNDGTLRLWQSGLTCSMNGTGNNVGQCLDAPTRLTGHTKPIRAVVWSPDGRFLASAGDDGQVLVWYPAQQTTPILKVTQNAAINALAWAPNGMTLASASGNNVTLWAVA
jgi:WD40 repeat protein